MTTTSGRKLHIVSYYTKRDALQVRLCRVSENPSFIGEGGGEWGLEVDEQDFSDPALSAGASKRSCLQSDATSYAVSQRDLRAAPAMPASAPPPAPSPVFKNIIVGFKGGIDDSAVTTRSLTSDVPVQSSDASSGTTAAGTLPIGRSSKCIRFSNADGLPTVHPATSRHPALGRRPSEDVAIMDDVASEKSRSIVSTESKARRAARCCDEFQHHNARGVVDVA